MLCVYTILWFYAKNQPKFTPHDRSLDPPLLTAPKIFPVGLNGGPTRKCPGPPHAPVFKKSWLRHCFRPHFQKWEGAIPPPAPSRLLRLWRWPGMTRTFHFYDVYNAKPGSLLRVKYTTVFRSCIFLHHHHKSASQSEMNWRNRKKLFETYARYRHKQITVDKASLSVFEE